MTKKTIARIVAPVVGLAMFAGAALPAGAATIAELQAQIQALMAQLAALQSAQSGAGASVTFTQNLTVGSTGSEVVALQQMLVAQGHLTMPAGVAFGNFGPLTRAAVAKWQAANGVSPAAGYWGALSRARAAALGMGGGTTTGGTVGGGATAGGTISTPGVEGTITVTKNPSPASGTKVYEGSTKVSVLGIKLEAKQSDLKVERIKLDLDENDTTATTDKEFYTKFADKVYVMDGSTVLASADLNASTVVEESNEISITLSGMSFIVPKGSTKVLTVALDAKASWDSTYNGDSWTVGVPAEGVRAVDGAGVNQYGPAAAFSNSITSEGELAESATLTISTNANTPQDMEVVAAQGASENEYDNLELLKFDLKAEKDAVKVTDLVVDVVRTGSGGATTTTGYLYDGATLIGSDSIDTDGHAGFTFSDIDYVVPKDSTKTLTLKVDVDSAATTATIFTADIDTADVTSENTAGTGVTESGSAQGESITVRSVGAEISLVSKNLTRDPGTIGIANGTSTARADFVFRVKAVGGDIIIGDAGSTTVPFASNAGGSHDDGLTFQVYRGGATAATSGASSTALTVPSGVINVTNNSFTIQEGNSVEIPVSFLFEGRTTAGALITTGIYQVGIAQLNWVSSAGIQESNFMDGNASWRTNSVSMP